MMVKMKTGRTSYYVVLKEVSIIGNILLVYILVMSYLFNLSQSWTAWPDRGT